MQTIVIFDMPDEENLLQEYLQAPRWRLAVENLSQWLRTQVKHGDHPEQALALYDEVRAKLFDFVQEEGLEL